MRLRNKIIFPFILFLFGVVLAFSTVNSSVKKDRAKMEKNINSAIMVNNHANNLVNQQRKSNECLLSYRFTKDDNYLTCITTTQATISQHVEQLQQIDLPSVGRDLINIYVDNRQGIITIKNSFIEAIKNDDEKLVSTYYQQWTERYDLLTASLSDLNAYSEKVLNDTTKDFENTLEKYYYTIAIILVSTAFIVIIHYLYLIKIIEKPLKKLINFAKHVSEGNFDERMQVTSDDEIGQLAINFNLMVREVKNLYQNLENKVKDKTEKLEASNQSLQEFAYAASHDLQEPLRKIMTFGDRLETKYGKELNDEAKDYLRRMQIASKRMSTLISDLLTYSRISTQTEAFREISMNSVIKESLSDLEIQIEESKAKIKVSNMPHIIADRSQIHQLFQNLIGNAIKYRDEKRKLMIEINYHKEKEWFVFEVKDNGIGFDDKYKEKIFQVFQRLHGQSEIPGTGVGLAVCKRILERHNGKIIAQSTPGAGSIFTVYLPIIQDNF